MERTSSTTGVFFGPEARRIAGRIAGDVRIVACEPECAAAVLQEAVSLRRAGLHFALSVHVEDVRAPDARAVTRTLLDVRVLG